MYEAEVNNRFESIAELPEEIRSRFSGTTDGVVSRTVLPWGEHCTECNWPTCYRTCELYSPRGDGACRQFVDGMVRIDNVGGLNAYILKMTFKRWAKLWTVGNLRMLPRAKADRRERSNIVIGSLVRNIPMPKSARARAQRKVNYLRRVAAEHASSSVVQPDYFLVECYNPNHRTIKLTLTVRHRGASRSVPFQEALDVAKGYTAAKVPFAAISRAIDLQQPFEVEIVPNDCDNTTLYFGAMDFVKEAPLRSETATSTNESISPAGPKWKCIVWDLDNTLWDGILVEDGVEKLRLRQSVVDVIKETDRRGILHSVASKNNPEDARRFLHMCGLDDYFLYPQINWEPKSQSIAQIANLLNVGVDSIAFVDDQPFEREEVKAALPGVSLVDARDHTTILTRPECCVPVTEESKERRRFYQEQQQRKEKEVSFRGNYSEFLKDCRIEIEISPLNEGNLERVYELAQRTNQMNFSDCRYPRSRLTEIMSDASLRTYVMKCTDRFGSYGIVGFAVVDLKEPRLLDLMFSCRVQSKRIEHAFLSLVLKTFVSDEGRDFFANYKKTAKNTQSGKVFEEIGFSPVSETGGVTSLVFKRDRAVPDDRIISIAESFGDSLVPFDR